MDEKERVAEDISREIERSVIIPEETVPKLIAEKEERIAKGVAEIPIIRDELDERKRKIVSFFKQKHIWVTGLLLLALILGMYIRSLPMQAHGDNPGLWDIATDTWTLGPDLDPWLFARYAKTIVETGGLPKIDHMRFSPVGFETSKVTRLLPYMIAGVYYFFSTFDSTVNVEFAAVIFPVIMFGFTIISFFLFSREIFIDKGEREKTKANIIALIATFFMIVIPSFLSRTIAGIPEKESAAFFFMFLALYLFLRAWKVEKMKNTMILAVLAGAVTAIMGLIWGGVVYLLAGIGIANLLGFIVGKVKQKGFLIYSLWMITSLFFLLTLSDKYSLIRLIQSTDHILVFITFFVMLVNYILWKTSLSKINIITRSKLPRSIISLIVSAIVGFILVLVFFGPSFLIDKIQGLYNTFITPTTGRWGITVAENRQPYFNEWASNFGPFIKGIPLLFWTFFLGSVMLFKKMLDCLKSSREKYVLTGAYILFFFGLVFSRYSSVSLFNGENFISKIFYFGSALILIGIFIRYYLKHTKQGENYFNKINYNYLFLFSLFVLILFTVRSAVRLIMVLVPLASIFAGYFIYDLTHKFRKIKDDTWKLFIGILLLLVLISSLFTFWTFYNESKNQAYNTVPSYYNQQWQKAMSWVRENTPTDAVFSHWWDYGYWVQSIGERATVLDGGNNIVYWNYLMGRLVLTGDNQEDALEFLYNHEATHLLIDSTDVGKYTAFSSIGSDESYDRYSWIGTFLLDPSQTVETQNRTNYIYSGAVSLDEDLVIPVNGKETLLPKQQAGIGAIILPEQKEGNESAFMQPYIVVVYQGKQEKIALKYLYLQGQLIEFEEGIEACMYILPKLESGGQGIQINPAGAAMYLSPRLMRGLLTQVYLLENSLGNFDNFELIHTEPNLIIDSFNKQGANLPDFIYYQGLQGPIKIWEIKYEGDEQIKEEYLDKDYTKYIDWKL